MAVMPPLRALCRHHLLCVFSGDLKDDSPVNSGLISTFIVSNHEMEMDMHMDMEQSPLPHPFVDNARLLDSLSQLAS